MIGQTGVRTPLTVTQLNTYLKARLEEDPRLASVFVVGEISNFTNHYRSGHLYFSLKDERSVLRCVMFARNAARLRFAPEDGMRVLARGRVKSVMKPPVSISFTSEDLPAGWARCAQSGI